MSNLEIQKPIMLTMKEAEKRLGKKRGTLHKYIRLGRIRSIKFFEQRLILESEIERLERDGTK